MRITDFDLYQTLLKEKSGLWLTEDKSSLLETRLSPIAKKWGYPTFNAMTIALQGVPDNQLVNDVVEAMATSETSFFRDGTPFETLKDHVIPALQERRPKKREIKIWSAGAASGQEPCSIAITLKELESSIFAGWESSIFATDLSRHVIEQAKEGAYSQTEVQRGLPVQLLLKYFTQDDNKWRLSKDIRSMIKYDTFNLIDTMAGMGTFDIIFCRNVLSTFETSAQTDVLNRLKKHLEPDGFLFLGKDEAVPETVEGLSAVAGKTGLYTPAE